MQCTELLEFRLRINDTFFFFSRLTERRMLILVTSNSLLSFLDDVFVTRKFLPEILSRWFKVLFALSTVRRDTAISCC